MTDEGDPIADTGQFRAFVERGDDPAGTSRGLIIAVLAVVIIAVIVVAALFFR
ncbi:MAG: hypothetical protein ABJA34_07865 [Pseudonocardiales bacterium]